MIKIFKNKDLLNASLYTFSSLCFAQAASFGVFFCLAKIGGSERFGQFSILYNSAQFLSILCVFGLNIPLTKLISEENTIGNREQIGRFISFSYQVCLVIGLIILSLTLLFGSRWSSLFAGSEIFQKEMMLLNVFIVMNSLNSIQTGILLGFKDFKSFFVANIFRGFSLSLLLIGFYYADLVGAFAGLGAAALLQTIIGHRLIKATCNRLSVSFSLTKSPFGYSSKLLHLAIPFLLSSLFVYPLTWLTNRMIVMFPGGYSELGVFNISFQLRSIIAFIPTSLGNVVLPEFASRFASGDADRLSSSLRKAMGLFALTGFAISALVILFSTPIINFYSSKFILSPALLYVTAVTSFVLTVQMPYGFLVNAIGKMWEGFILNLMWAIALLGCAYYYIDGENDAIELAYCYLFAYVLHAGWTSLYVFYFLRKMKREALPLADQ